MDIKRLIKEIYILLKIKYGVGTETTEDQQRIMRARIEPDDLPVIIDFDPKDFESLLFRARPIEVEKKPELFGLNGTAPLTPFDFKNYDYVSIDLMTSENVVKSLWEVGPKFFILPEDDYPGPIQLHLFALFNKKRFKLFSTHGLSVLAVSLFLNNYMELNTFVSLTGFSYINAVDLCDCFHMDKLAFNKSLRIFIEQLQSPPVIDPVLVNIKPKDFYTLRWIASLAKKGHRLFLNEQAVYFSAVKNKTWDEDGELKAYSSVVERTAHNGLVVGSNPTKPS